METQSGLASARRGGHDAGMKNAALVLFFALALGLVFYGGLRTAEKLREPVINEVKVTVEQRATIAAAPRKSAIPHDIVFTPLPDTPLQATERDHAETIGKDVANATVVDDATTRQATGAVITIEPVPPPLAETGPLQISYPKPAYVGTPVVLHAPVRGGEGGVVTAPAGTRLLSRGMPVTASDSAPLTGELSYITDGDKSAGEDSVVELAGGLQWVQIDLKDVHRIYAVAVWHFHLQPRVYRDVIVLVSNDPDFKSGVLPVTRDVYTGVYFATDPRLKAGALLFNNDEDNSAGWSAGTDEMYTETNRGLVVSGWGLPARYVRLYANGNTSNGMNHYIEVEVYGL